MANFISKIDPLEVTSADVTVSVTGNFVSLQGDQEVFGNKEFVNDVTIQGDLLVAGETRVTQIVDFTSSDGDISGYVLRGTTGYFDEIIVGNIVGSDGGDDSGGEASGGLDTGPVFVSNVTAVNGVREILESDFGGAVIKKIKTAADEVDVELLVERGDAQAYKPSIEYFTSGDPSSSQMIDSNSLSTHYNGYSFKTTVRVDSSSEATYLFKNGGRKTYLIIEKDQAPEVVESLFVNQSNGTFYGESSFSSHSGYVSYVQTEAKNGDSAKVSVTATKPIQQLIILSGGALNYKTINNPSNTDNGDGTYTVEATATIGGSSNSVVSKGFSVQVKDSSGNLSVSYSSDNQIITNNSSPSGSLNFTYPNGQSVIDNMGQTVDINVTATNFDEYNYSFSSVLDLKSSPSNLTDAPFVFSGEGASTYTSGTMSVQLFKSSNGRTSSASSSSVWIQSYGPVPSLTLSKTVFNSSPSGLVHNFNISVGEPLEDLSIVSSSEPSVTLGTITKNNNTSFSFSITVSDGSARGPFDMVFQGTKLQSEVFQSTKVGTVRGFSQRSVTALATEYLAVDIGVDVYNVNKLSVTVQPDGGSSFSVPYDANLSGPKQDGASNLEGAFGIINGREVLIDNQVITNAGNILDVIITIEESL